MTRTVCLIPARGGSKRLPRKNVVDFLGRPIIAYTIEAATRSGLFERVVVSTEDAEIAEISRRCGARVHARPVSLATDNTRIVDVCLAYLDDEARDGRDYDVFACLLATAPLRRASDIVAVSYLIEPGRCDFAMAITDYPVSPLQALREDGAGFLVPMWPDLVDLRRHEAPALWVDNGSTYFATVPAFRATRNFHSAGLRGYPMPRERSVDINDPTDLELARYWAERLGA